MQVGVKATRHNPYEKMCVSRHGSRMTRRAANACEKAIETRVRRLGKKACKEDR